MSTTTLRLCAMALLLPLAACVNMSGLSGGSKYACAAPEGVACDSVSGTYANALHENLPSQRTSGTAAGGGRSGAYWSRMRWRTWSICQRPVSTWT